MNKKILSLILLVFVVSFSPFLCAKAVSPEVGTIKTFSSENKVYSIDIKILGYPDNSPSECTLKKGEEILWTKEIPATPGFVDISNDGKYLIFVNWGWYDEGGFKSISFYTGDGELLKIRELNGGLRWISKTRLSGDGNYYLVADNSSQVTLYNVPTQTIVWDKQFKDRKLELELNNVLISQQGGYILISTFDHTTYNAHFSYLNREGKLLWEKEIKHGYSFNKNLIWLSEDGLNFKIQDINQNKWLEFENKKNRVILKKTSISGNR
jgi:hypothetical protein